MLLPKSSMFYVCCSEGLSGQSTIFGLLGGGCGHIHVLKTSPRYIDSKYMWVHGSNSLGSSPLAEIPFLAFLALHRERKRCGQVGPSPCYFQSEVVYAYRVLDL